jgi:hypothetical protein
MTRCRVSFHFLTVRVELVATLFDRGPCEEPFEKLRANGIRRRKERRAL